jgi:hypothetical protein
VLLLQAAAAQQLHAKHATCRRQHAPAAAPPSTPLPQVPMSRLLALNRPEWAYGLAGVLGSAAAGCAQPAVAFLLSAFITVFYIRDVEEMKRQVGPRAPAAPAGLLGLVLLHRCVCCCGFAALRGAAAPPAPRPPLGARRPASTASCSSWPRSAC